MNRRDFLKLSACAAAVMALPALVRVESEEGAVAVGTVTGDVLTVGNVMSGTIKPGMRVTGCGIDRDTFVITQTSGGAPCGTYAVTLKHQFASSQALIFTR